MSLGARIGRRGGDEGRSKRKAAEPRPQPYGEAISTLAGSARKPDLLAVRVGRRRVATVDRRAADALGLAAGTEWTPALEARVREAERRLEARSLALKILGHRAVTRRELLRRLERKGHALPDAEAAADALAKMGLLDDQALAARYVASQLERKPAGSALLRAKLARRGVESAVARRVVDEALAAGNPLEDATDLARRRLERLRAGRTGKTLEPMVVKRRIFGLLARRGFDAETARRAVEAAMKSVG